MEFSVLSPEGRSKVRARSFEAQTRGRVSMKVPEGQSKSHGPWQGTTCPIGAPTWAER